MPSTQRSASARAEALPSGAAAGGERLRADGLGQPQLRAVAVDRLDVLATAQDALLGGHSRDLERDQERADQRCVDEERADEGRADEGRADQECADGEGSRAREWAEGHGWRTFPQDLLVGRLDRAWEACEQAGVPLDEADLHRYARAMEEVAEVDVEAVPVGAAEAVRRVVVGTVMVEPVLSALRLMAQREVSMRRSGQRPAEEA